MTQAVRRQSRKVLKTFSTNLHNALKFQELDVIKLQ